MLDLRRIGAANLTKFAGRAVTILSTIELTEAMVMYKGYDRNGREICAAEIGVGCGI